VRRFLVLYWYPKELQLRLAVRQHLRALDRGGDEVIYHNAVDPPPLWLRWSQPDAVILHTIFLGLRWDQDFASFERQYRWVFRLRCPKLALPQDEYDHSEVLEEWLVSLATTHVFSNFGQEQRDILYPRLKHLADFKTALTGYIDNEAAEAAAARMIPLDQRPYDIVYRAAKLPYWFGSHGQLKHRIGSIASMRARELGLRTDISTDPADTIYGDQWLDFVMSGRAIVGCESGSSVLDRRGAIQDQIRRMLLLEPDLTFDEVDARMDPGWDSYAFFAISPRHLEAVITKTCQILVEGSYSGVLQPGRHYIPVRRDLTDLDRALELTRDIDLLREMTERAYEDIYVTGRYTTNHFAEQLRDVVTASPVRDRVRLPLTALLETSATAKRRLSALFPSLQPIARFAKATSKLLSVRSARTTLRHVIYSARGHGATVARRWPAAARTVVRLRMARVIMTTLIRNKRLRRLVLRTRPAPRQLARDVLRLGVLERLRRYEATPNLLWWVSASCEEGTLVLRTETLSYQPSRAVIPSDIGTIRRVLWDHSAIGSIVPLDPRRGGMSTVSIGPDGRYVFGALSSVLPEFSSDVVEAFRWSRG
jgi:hypothetical protein